MRKLPQRLTDARNSGWAEWVRSAADEEAVIARHAARAITA